MLNMTLLLRYARRSPGARKAWMFESDLYFNRPGHAAAYDGHAGPAEGERAF